MSEHAAALDKADTRTLRSGFLASAHRMPDAPALRVAGRTFTYAELEHIARRWAGGIVGGLGRPAERVGVLAYRSHLSYAGVLAALCSGAAFVPLNPRFPVDRTRAMVRLAALDAIIVEASYVDQLARVLDGVEPTPLVICPESTPPPGSLGGRVVAGTDLAHVAPLAALPSVLPDEHAYLLFTSGSTGAPKGVPVTHANILYYLDQMSLRFGITPDDRFSQTFDQTFDVSVFDLFLAWEHGASVCALEAIDLLAPARFVAKNAVTVWFSVPSIVALMRKKNLLRSGTMPTLRWSLFAGEPLPRASAGAWLDAAPNSIVENLYGPTELTITCFAYRWDPAQSPAACENGFVPMGRPNPGLGALIVDEALRPVPDGEPGELCVCGPQVVPGYWRDREKTDECFVALPVASLPGARFYRTGDRVRRLETGDYLYLGRTDQQIKVLGQRVELGEIETILRRDAHVSEAIALGWPVKDGSAEGIIAFISGVNPNPEALRLSLRAKLPEHMVPSRIVVLEELPLNPNGKTDRQALRGLLERDPACA